MQLQPIQQTRGEQSDIKKAAHKNDHELLEIQYNFNHIR